MIKNHNGIYWKIKNNTLISNNFSIPIDKIESVKIERKWRSTILGIVSLISGLLFLIFTISLFTDDADTAQRNSIIIYLLISLSLILLAINLFGALKILIFSGGRKYKISCAILSGFILFKEERDDIIHLKEYLDSNLGLCSPQLKN